MPGARIRLGLIGEGISRSLAPRLHEHLGRVHGLPVTYELLDGRGVAGFDPLAVARHCADSGFTGVNVTQPFKRVLHAHVRIEDPAIARIGAVNTVRLLPQGWTATNTDYTGFLKAYRGRFGATSPGEVLLAGAGGVGCAIAFALAALGATRLRLCDTSEEAARALADAVTAGTGTPASVVPPRDLAEAMQTAAGIVNATPLGTHLLPGAAFPLAALKRQAWAFDAVYTPVWTEFLRGARAAGLAVLTGFDLFFHQGLDAFEAFTGRATDPQAVRSVVAGWVPEAE